MHRTDLAYSVCNCSASSPSTNMDAAALRQCLCNAGSPGFSHLRVLIMHFMTSFFAKGAVAVACVLYATSVQKRRESIFRLLTGVLSVQTTPRAMHRSSSLKRTSLLIPRRILCKSLFLLHYVYFPRSARAASVGAVWLARMSIGMVEGGHFVRSSRIGFTLAQGRYCCQFESKCE